MIVISCLYSSTNSFRNIIGNRVLHTYSNVLMSTGVNEEVLSSSIDNQDDNFKAPIAEIDRRRNFCNYITS